MKKITALGAALSLSLLLSSAVFGGEILTPGIIDPSPPPTTSVSGEAVTASVTTEEVLPSTELLQCLLALVF